MACMPLSPQSWEVLAIFRVRCLGDPVGLFNAFIAGYVSSTWADAFTFILLIVILIVRPTGILGERVAEKV